MNNIQDKMDNLFDKLEESKIYKDYVKIKKQLEDDKEIIDLIEEIKKYQKIAANNKDKSVEEKLQRLYFRLESYPIYQSYLITKEALNEELFMIKETFEKYFEELLRI